MTILLAGVDKDARADIESTVRRALADQGCEPATVSLVRVGARWSVTIERPRSTRLSFTAEQDRLETTIREAVGSARGATPPPQADATLATPAVPSESRVQEDCEDCRRTFVVVYEARADEPEVRVAVACPHCWHINRVTVGDWAASGHDFRAEKA